MRTSAAVALVATMLAGSPLQAQVTQQGSQRLRLSLAAFDNKTGDAALDQISTRISDALTAMGAELPGTELVRGGGSVSMQGTVWRHGDQLQIDVIAVGPDGKAIHRLPPERAPSADVSRAVQAITARIAGMAALHADAEKTAPHLESVPTLAAYRLARKADSLFAHGQPAQALPVVYQAVQIDSMYVKPLFLAVAIHDNAGRTSVGDSLLAVLRGKRDRLTEYEQIGFSWHRDLPPKAFASARKALSMDPRSDLWTYGVGLVANRAGYFHDAVEVLSRRADHARRGSLYARSWPPWRGQLLIALHASGEYKRALEEITLARTELPNATQNTFVLDELRNLAALGRLEEFNAITRRMLAMRPDSVPIATVNTAAFELRRHGHKAYGDRLLGDLTAIVVANEDKMDSLAFASQLAVSRRYEEALPRLERLAAGSTNLTRVGRYGVFSVFAGRNEVGDQVMTRLAELGDNAASHLWRGLLTAARGDCQGAVAHFRTAVDKGQIFSAATFFHLDVSTEPIWGCEAWQKLAPMKAP